MKKIVIFVVVCLVLTVVGGFQLKSWFERAGSLEKTAYVTIPKGANLRVTAGKLADEGVIDKPWLFYLAARIQGIDKHLKAGEYAFLPRTSMAEVLQKIAAGDVYYRRLTLPEGLYSGQLIRLIAEAPALNGSVEAVPAEGSLLPETYSYQYGENRQELVNRAQAAMKKVLDEAWNGRDENLPLKNKEELLVLASIIEKETGVPEERGLVASVFVNRLRKGMKLQTDPTVIYALTEGKKDLGRSLRRRDLRIDSPYNTYKYYGLPPTPICNPGREAIMAAAHPEKSDFLYFVANGRGGHNFSKTLNEHNRHVRNWVNELRRQ